MEVVKPAAPPATSPGAPSAIKRSSVNLSVRGLSAMFTNEKLERVFSDFGPLRSAFVVPKASLGFVKFALPADANKALQALNGRTVNGCRLQIEFALPKGAKVTTNAAHPRRVKKEPVHRVIVRNLAFHASEADLREALSPSGPIVAVTIPEKPHRPGLRIGYALVDFADEQSASNAVRDCNGKQINGREVALDIFIPKDKQRPVKQEIKQESVPEEAPIPVEEASPPPPALSSESSRDSDSNEMTNSDESDTDESDSEEEDDIEEEGSNEEVEEEVEEEDEGKEGKDYERDDMEDESKSRRKDGKLPRYMRQRQKDEMRRTIFVLGISFSATDSELADHFSTYGEVDEIKIVKNHATGLSRGMCFVRFKRRSSAQVAMLSVESTDHKTDIGGRPCTLHWSVDREGAAKLRAAERIARNPNPNLNANSGAVSEQERDKRNLYLAYEGAVVRGTPSALGLNEADLKRREAAFAEKRRKLKNPNCFVSRTRLSVRNMPKGMNANALRELVRAAATGDGQSAVHVREARVVRKDRDSSEGARRKDDTGFGFVEVDTHEGALRALRALNNNPGVFPDGRRLMVEFAVEDARKLHIQADKTQRYGIKPTHVVAEYMKTHKFEAPKEEARARRGTEERRGGAGGAGRGRKRGAQGSARGKRPQKRARN